MSSCRTCGATIQWVRTAKNDRLMPLNAEPDPDGNVELIDGKAVVHHQPPLDHGTLFMPHHATCPNWQPSV